LLHHTILRKQRHNAPSCFMHGDIAQILKMIWEPVHSCGLDTNATLSTFVDG
jgi:hypothetical protein